MFNTEPHSAPLFILALIVGMAAMSISCSEEPARISDDEATPIAEEPVLRIPEIRIDRADPSPVSGRFEVVNFELTPVAVIDENEALDWLGQLIVYSKDFVGTEAELCETPSFLETTEQFSEYFSVYNLSPETFGLQSPEIEIITVSCDGELWSGVGAETFRIAGDTLVTIYDGVFLSLEPY